MLGLGKDVAVELSPKIANMIFGENSSKKNIAQKLSDALDVKLNENDIDVLIDMEKSGILEFTEPFVIRAFYENYPNATVEDITEKIISSAVLSGPLMPLMFNRNTGILCYT